MKKILTILFIASIIALSSAAPVYAMSEAPPPPNINDVFGIFAALIGFPAFLAACINVGKAWFGLSDGLAPKIVLWATLTAFVGCGIALFMGKLEVVRAIDLQLGYAGTFLLTFSAFVTELGLAKGYHAILRGTPVIGKSYTYDAMNLPLRI
jgi:hypothetical protein